MSNAQATRVSTSDDQTESPSLEGLFSSDAALAGERQTVVVQTVFRGIGTGARVLPAPGDVQRTTTAAPLIGAGAALCLCALALFAMVAVDLAGERRAFSAWGTSGHEPGAFSWKTRSRGLDVAFFAGLVSGGLLVAWGLHRRRQGRAQQGLDFLVGSSPEVDAPVDARYVSSPAHRLVATDGDSYVLHATPQMDGEITVGGEVFPLGELLRRQGPALRLPPGGRARLSCGDMIFVVASIGAPAALAKPVFKWNPNQDPYTLGAALALGLFLVMVFSVPPDPRSLSLDLLGNESHLLSFRIAPPVENVPLAPSVLPTAAAAAGRAGKAHAGEAGHMGDKSSKARDRRMAIVGPIENRNIRLAKEVAAESARTAGILGVFKRLDGGPVASIFTPESALGDAAENVLGNLHGAQVGSSWGLGGLGAHGTGAGGGGTGQTTLGVGILGTIGSGTGADGNGPGRYGTAVGQLASRHRIRIPEYIPGDPNVRGSLDKEIVRRIIRRHLNEVKFCYEEELLKKPSLSGRIMVQFMIAANGQVLSSVLQSSTMGNVRVENCTVQAVKRWPFPQPKGGGLVQVTYPFVLAPAGS